MKNEMKNMKIELTKMAIHGHYSLPMIDQQSNLVTTKKDKKYNTTKSWFLE